MRPGATTSVWDARTNEAVATGLHSLSIDSRSLKLMGIATPLSIASTNTFGG